MNSGESILVDDVSKRPLERYRLLSQHARDIVLFIRLDGRVVEANDAAVLPSPIGVKRSSSIAALIAAVFRHANSASTTSSGDTAPA